MYKFKILKTGVSVYRHNNLCCIIDDDFAKSQGYKTALEYCENVFN